MLGELFTGLGLFFAYYILVACLLFVIKITMKPPEELMRKLLHFVCFMSVFVLLAVFTKWYLAVFTIIVFILVIYPILTIVEKFPKLMEVFFQRREGEVKSSFLLVYFMMTALITVFWGVLGEEWKFVIIVAILAWGFGDAAAALVGKALGRHQVNSRFVEETKTIEGSLSMFIVSMIVLLITLLVYTPISWHLCFISALIIAPLCALTELVSHKGTDTISVPFATALSVFVLINFFNNWGI